MRYAALLLCAFVLPSNCCFAQYKQSDSLVVDISITTNGNNGEYTIQTTSYNAKDEFRTMRFEYLIQKQDINNNRSKIEVSDSFRLGPREKRIVGIQQVNFSPGDIFKILLSVYEGNEVVATDSLFKIFPKRILNDQQTQKSKTLKDSIDTDPNLFLDFSGFVIDETRTRAGRDLYDLFYTRWLSFDNVQGDYTIRFEELPFRGLNTILKVYLNDEQKVEQVIQPNYDFLESFADWLSGFLQFHVQQLKQVESDLEKDLIGTDVDIY